MSGVVTLSLYIVICRRSFFLELGWLPTVSEHEYLSDFALVASLYALALSKSIVQILIRIPESISHTACDECLLQESLVRAYEHLEYYAMCQKLSSRVYCKYR